ncbi:MAG TPA: VOC family protein [Aliicoccus persicus]|uniref:VOC family protein n=1 Tax=Aliicoccus persicus TaxID=930138 RepID=A0A921B5V4_9STAP|nr:VOC family protein [Aliicoccus persicus]
MIKSQIMNHQDLDEMIAFYNDIFGDVEVLESRDIKEHENDQFRHVRILDHEFYLMRGPHHPDKVPAIFYMVVFPENRRHELEQLHVKLREGGRDLSHVEDMKFSDDLYLLQDKYGVLWHFWSDDYCEAPGILPSLVMHDDMVGKIDEMKTYYEIIFEDVEFGEVSYLDNGLIDHVSMRLLNYELQVRETSEKDLFSLTAVSLLVLDCETQEEIDKYHNGLVSESYSAGWLKDKMGIVWIVDWVGIHDLLKDANPKQAKAMFAAIDNEDPICIEDVKTAYEDNVD